MTIKESVENIYASLHEGNKDIDLHIAALKTALAGAGEKAVVFDPDRLAQNNRQGRKMMESYFKKRGVTITFKTGE